MNCVRSVSYLDDRIAGDLPPGAAAELDEHLEGCAQCRAALEELRLLKRALADLPAPRPGPDVLERMLQAATRSAPPARRSRAWPGWRVGLATAAVLLLAIGFILGRRFATYRAPAPQIVLLARPITVGPSVTDITLVFRASDAVRKANISLKLPDDVQIAGRPNVRRLNWRADLKSGANLLQLPLQATGAYDGGTLVVRLSQGSLVKTLEIPVAVRQAPNTGAVRTPQRSTQAIG
ncbi:MAG TPA: zf-HC2 domain-containing protein [Steroidobacteraceae bacterium]|jgi:hypothetical protein|nr:zf-HC2 domain-containing protein [Steroidobacteraceae bacterium]